MADTSIAQFAQQAYDHFYTAVRPDSEDTFVRTRDDAPEWLHDLVREAHGEFLPDDWRYESIRDALGFIADNDPDNLDDGHEWADANVDVYTGRRFAWLSSNLQRSGYCDEAQEEGLAGENAGVVDLAGLGQYMESLEVWASVVESLREHVAAMA